MANHATVSSKSRVWPLHGEPRALQSPSGRVPDSSLSARRLPPTPAPSRDRVPASAAAPHRGQTTASAARTGGGPPCEVEPTPPQRRPPLEIHRLDDGVHQPKNSLPYPRIPHPVLPPVPSRQTARERKRQAGCDRGWGYSTTHGCFRGAEFPGGSALQETLRRRTVSTSVLRATEGAVGVSQDAALVARGASRDADADGYGDVGIPGPHR